MVPPQQPHDAGQPVVPLVQPIVPPAQPDPVPPLNWSHFKPEFASKPDEDLEAYLLRTNNWMDTHAFPVGFKVQRFCFTSVDEARLWHKSLRAIAVD